MLYLTTWKNVKKWDNNLQGICLFVNKFTKDNQIIICRVYNLTFIMKILF